MGSVVFTDTYSQTGYNASTQNVRINYSESYDASNNTTTVSLTSIEFASTLNFGNCPIRGAVAFNSTGVIDMPSTTTAYNVSVYGGGTYGTVSQSSGTRSITVPHNSNGEASFTVYLNTASSSGYNTFGVQYSGKYFGVRTSVNKSVSLTKHTSTLTINPNGGTWNGGKVSVSYSQAPTSTKPITNPTRTGYRFTGWSLSGGGSLSGTTYTFGASNGTLTAQWAKNEFSLTFAGDTHSVINVTRNGESLNDGDTIYYGDVLNLNISAMSGYQIETRNPTEDQITVTGNVTILVTTSPMATIHIRKTGNWNMYLFNIRKNAQWQLYQANIRKNGQWQKYY